MTTTNDPSVAPPPGGRWRRGVDGIIYVRDRVGSGISAVHGRATKWIDEAKLRVPFWVTFMVVFCTAATVYIMFKMHRVERMLMCVVEEYDGDDDATDGAGHRVG